MSYGAINKRPGLKHNQVVSKSASVPAARPGLPVASYQGTLQKDDNMHSQTLSHLEAML